MVRRFVLSLVFGLAIFLPASAQEKTNPADVIAPLVSEKTILIYRVDVTKLDVAQMVREIKNGTDDAQLAKKAERELQKMLAPLLADGVREVYALTYIPDGGANPFVFAVPVNKGNVEKVAKHLRQVIPLADVQQIGDLLVAHTGPGLQQLIPAQPFKNPHLAQAFAEVNNAEAQSVFVLSDKLRNMILKDLPPRLPPELGGGNPADLVKSFRWSALGMNLKPNSRSRFVLQFADAQGAQKVEALYKKATKTLIEKTADKGPESWGALLKTFRPKVANDQLVVEWRQEELRELLMTSVKKVRDAANRMESTNNLKQIGITFHDHHDAYRTLPAQASYDPNGKPLLSWPVHIMPFIDEDDLYKQIILDEHWDSQHNKKMIAKMPKLYRSPFSNAKPGMTTYLVPVGKDTIFGKKPLSFRQITDGLSNTLMIVEADDDKAVIWTKPEDLPIDPKNPHRGLGNNRLKIILAGFADGHVQVIPPSISAEMLNRLFRYNDGKVVELPE